jgi:Bacterial transglutaminase-like N-terminal region
MTLLTVRHLTVYRYHVPVGFGDHRMLFRPRDGHDQKVLEEALTIIPEPTQIRFW